MLVRSTQRALAGGRRRLDRRRGAVRCGASTRTIAAEHGVAARDWHLRVGRHVRDFEVEPLRVPRAARVCVGHEEKVVPADSQ